MNLIYLKEFSAKEVFVCLLERIILLVRSFFLCLF